MKKNTLERFLILRTKHFCPECQRDDVEWELRHKGEDVWCLSHDECSVRLYLPTGILDVAA